MALKLIATAGTLALLAFSALPGMAQDNILSATAPRANTSTIIVGSANFPESQLLGTIDAKALSAKGLAVETKFDIGGREVYFPALLDGSIDVLPEYIGATLSYLDKNATAHSPEDVAVALKAVLPEGITMLTPSKAQDSDMLAVTRATAERYKLKTIADLAPVAGDFTVGAAPEWKTRKEGILGLKEVYGVEFGSFKPLDAGGPLTVSALANGQIQAGNLFSTDPAIAASDFVPLEDVKNLFPAQNVVPVIAAAKASDALVVKTLDAISAALTTEDLIEMNGRLANHEGFDLVANDFLAKKGLQ